MLSQSLTIHDERELMRGLALMDMRKIYDEAPKYAVQVLPDFPPLTQLQSVTFIGSFAWTCPAEDWKIIKSKNAISLFDGWLTPAEVARYYITARYGRPGRLTSQQYNEVMRQRSAPLYAVPCEVDKAVYIDLKSAYWSILQVIGWDVDYMPGKWLAVKSSVQDFPLPKHKLARNCLVSTGLVGNSKMWDGSRLIFRAKRNPLTNMMLWAAVQDTLNCIADDMVRAGALYVHTDGYILRDQDAAAGIQVLNDWGLVGTVREEGKAKILGVGTYEIGSHRNARVGFKAGRKFSKIDARFKTFLKPRFTGFSSRVELILG